MIQQKKKNIKNIKCKKSKLKKGGEKGGGEGVRRREDKQHN